jgi:NAD(P)-dependent dehydrogenase (short-subunit alcohol dehydrogenase family)
LKGSRNFAPTYHHDTYCFVDPSKADLRRKRILIQGASYDIGRVIVVSYSKAYASALALAAPSDLGGFRKELQETAITAGRSRPKVLIYQLDGTNAYGVEDATRKFAHYLDSLDILLNNAGYGSTWDFADQTDPNDWWKIWEGNVKGTWVVIKYFLPLPLKSELRTVVLFKSIALIMVSAGSTSYPISKFAVSRMAEVFARDYEKEGLGVIAFNPGDIPTSLSRKLPVKASDAS